MKFSVVIATWNEGSQISSYLKRLRQISQQSPMEVIVVDGGSDDGTAALAREWADHVVALPQTNRGAQLDAGARIATGDLLFFLRADAQPPGNWQQALEHFWLATHPKKVAASTFTVDYGTGMKLRWASRVANAAVGWGVAYGDHGLATTPEIYKESGGYPPFAYREDVEFCKRLARFGQLARLPEVIWPAGRRLRRAGVLTCGLEHGWLALRHKLGASPDDLWRSYAGL